MCCGVQNLDNGTYFENRRNAYIFVETGLHSTGSKDCTLSRNTENHTNTVLLPFEVRQERNDKSLSWRGNLQALSSTAVYLFLKGDKHYVTKYIRDVWEC